MAYFGAYILYQTLRGIPSFAWIYAIDIISFINLFLLIKALYSLVSSSEGDLRKAITYMQCAAKLKPDQCIKSSDVLEIAGVIYL